jgi:glycosyltransferase involved in cell wall biosynthesis
VHSIVPAPFPHYSLREQLSFPRLLKKSGIDLLFSPHFNVPFFCPIPFVVTIHDLILHRFPNSAPASKMMAYKIILIRALMHAENILTVSRFTASEIQKLYGIKEEKLTVISEGVNPSFAPASQEEQGFARDKYRLDKPFFLYIGNAKEHKNVQMLIDAFAASGSNDELILVTGGKESKRLRLASGVRILSDVPDSDLPSLYSATKAFVTASLYEGCGLPILEAQACGCPVIAINLTAIPEAADNNAMLVEPTLDNFKDAFLSPPTRKGTPLPPPSWENTAKEVAEALL